MKLVLPKAWNVAAVCKKTEHTRTEAIILDQITYICCQKNIGRGIKACLKLFQKFIRFGELGLPYKSVGVNLHLCHSSLESIFVPAVLLLNKVQNKNFFWISTSEKNVIFKGEVFIGSKFLSDPKTIKHIKCCWNLCVWCITWVTNLI